jgi:phage protein D
MATSTVINTTPTLRIDGQPNELASSLLLGMEMAEQAGGMAALELRFSNVNSKSDGSADFAFEDGKVLKLGSDIAVYGGDLTNPQEIFRGKITAIEAYFPSDGPPELQVLAEDLLQQARLKRRTAVFENKSLADLVKKLASDLALQPKVDGLTDNIGVQVQYNESDLAFVRRLLERYDADMQVVGTELHAAPRKQVQRNQLTLELNHELRSLRVTADLAHQRTAVTVNGWDITQGKTVGASSQADPIVPGQGTPGLQVLQKYLGERKEHIGHLAVADNNEAKTVANTAFERCARRFVVARGIAEGNPALRVGSFVTLNGLGPRFSNTYYVVRARHRYNTDRGYETEFEAECGGLGGAN